MLLALCLTLGALADPPRLDLPPRPADAPSGTALLRSLDGLSLADREAKIVAAVLAGNVPDSFRKLVPVTVREGAHTLTFYATPEYVSVGSDADAVRVPLSPAAAQRLADRLDGTLPTPKLVDDVYKEASFKFTPEPIPPSPAMTTVPVFLRHNDRIRAVRPGPAPGALAAGHKKDVVLTNRLNGLAGKVAIYGWHRPDGRPIQPVYTGHTDAWVDYSHGARLVSRAVVVDGRPARFEDVAADPTLAPLVSGEGVLTFTRYPTSADETDEFVRLDGGVRVLINRPAGPARGPVLLVIYALPNGNTIEQTYGKKPRPGDDWHFAIQQIAAQTRFVRQKLPGQTVVVAYLENDRKSWPAWRKAHGDGAAAKVVDAVRSRFPGPDVRVALTGHSGGGSLVFGVINARGGVPPWAERVAFLDANYAYDTERHRDAFVTWLKASDRNRLIVLAYDDASARLDGKPFVSAEGGTWGRSRRMLDDLGAAFPFREERKGDLRRSVALDGRVTFLLTENPGRKILHTVQVERNGLIECLLLGTPAAGQGYTYMGERAYDGLVREGGPGSKE